MQQHQWQGKKQNKSVYSAENKARLDQSYILGSETSFNLIPYFWRTISYLDLRLTLSFYFRFEYFRFCK